MRLTTSAIAGAGRGADDDKRARSEDRAVADFVKESPDETGLVLVVEVGRDVDGGHRVLLDPASLDPDCALSPVYASAAPKIRLPKVFAASACIPGSTCW